ncbi:MAG: hypothetical protein ACLFR1_01330 [Spirochaetia bacterium]
MNINNYTWLIPFNIDEDSNILHKHGTNQLNEKEGGLKTIQLLRQQGGG